MRPQTPPVRYATCAAHPDRHDRPAPAPMGDIPVVIAFSQQPSPAPHARVGGKLPMTTTAPAGVELWRAVAQQLRVDAIRTSSKAKSGHPSSAMSAADLMAVLLAKYLRYDFDQPANPN